tara:strand:+ start:162 stop:701 length:540 start_codon:yes stop_codon:yes gene_type:complete
LQTIAEKKALFKLPYHKNQIEYWGPVNSNFCDSLLSMSHDFLKKFLFGVHVRHLKEIFSVFVELVQNIAEYNQIKFADATPQSYVNLVINDTSVFITTKNEIKEKDVASIKNYIESLTNSTKEELKEKHRDALIEGKSLGLIIIVKMNNADFNYEIITDEQNANWLSIETTINYGSAQI